MTWNLSLASTLEDAPWENGITKNELLEWAKRNGVPQFAIENLQELEDSDELYYGIEDIWDDMPTTDSEFGWNSDEYEINMNND